MLSMLTTNAHVSIIIQAKTAKVMQIVALATSLRLFDQFTPYYNGSVTKQKIKFFHSWM